MSTKQSDHIEPNLPPDQSSQNMPVNQIITVVGIAFITLIVLATLLGVVVCYAGKNRRVRRKRNSRRYKYDTEAATSAVSDQQTSITSVD